MVTTHQIVKQVYDAKQDSAAADAFIRQYTGFIKAETAKFTHKIPQEGQDDEYSIAMFAFYEAILGYDKSRGSFLAYAAVGIKNRLIDYYRKEQRHTGIISLDEKVSDEEDSASLMSKIDSGNHAIEEAESKLAAKEEIQEFSKQLATFGISFSQVADNCPKQARTLAACHSALAYARIHTELLDSLLNTKKLPIAALAQGAGIERKTLERHRTYLVAVLVAYTNGYEIIRGHLSQISSSKGGERK